MSFEYMFSVRNSVFKERPCIFLGVYTISSIFQDLQNFYMSTVTFIFVIAMLLQVPQFQVDPFIKMFVFVAWAAYGVVPTFHWTMIMGGWDNPIVSVSTLCLERLLFGHAFFSSHFRLCHAYLRYAYLSHAYFIHAFLFLKL